MVAKARRTRTLTSAALLAVASLGAGIALPAAAESAHSSFDANGVDLVDGSFNLRLQVASIGSGDAQLPLIVYDRQFTNWSGIRLIKTIAGGVTSYSIYLAHGADYFSSSDGFASSRDGTGATLVVHSATWVTYSTLDGTTIDFQSPSPNQSGGTSNFCGPGGGNNCSLLPVTIKRRGGLTTNYDWTIVPNCPRPQHPDGPTNCNEYWRINTVSNAAGYSLAWTYVNPTGQPVPAWFEPSTVVLSNTRATGSGSTVTFTYPSNTVMTVTTPGGRTWTITGLAGILTGVRRPSASVDTTTVSYNSGWVSSVTRDGVTTNYSRSVAGSTATTTITDALSHTTTVVADLTRQRVTSVTNALSQLTTFVYDAVGRPTDTILPEGNKVHYDYDGRGNVAAATQIAKAGSGLANRATSATYPPSCTDAACNEPTTTTDALGHVTNYAYDGTTGLVTAVTLPAPFSGGTRPETRYSYTTSNGVSLLTGASTCRTGAAPACVGTADETRVATSFDTNLRPTSVITAAGDGSLSTTIATSYDAAGNVLTVDGPLAGTADTTTYRYGADREQVGVIGPDPDGAGPRVRASTRTTYNTDGQVSEVETGTVAGTADSDWAAFTSAQQVTTTYDVNARAVRREVTASGTTYGVAQTSYDAVGRVDCTVARMNPAVFGSLPGACTASTAGSAGPDRITRVTQYDPVNRATEVTSAYGTSAVGAEKTSFTTNGRPASVIDSNNNQTSYAYNGFDELYRTYYPSPTTGAGTSSTTDYEEFAYDATGNVTSRRLRDGTSIGFSYDNLNRTTAVDLPGSGYAAADRSYSYDLVGHMTQATDTNGFAATYVFDAFGRATSESSAWATKTYQYDLAGRRTRMTWQDGFYVTYDYDITGNMTVIRENGGTALATFAYDNLGRRTSLGRANGVTTTYGYNAASQLTSLAHDLAGTANDLTIGLSYNAAGQISSRTSSNDAWAWPGAVNVDRLYAANGLNQYTASGSNTPTYDARGNLTNAGGATYSYNALNLLSSDGNPLTYDALGRLNQVAGEPAVLDSAGPNIATELTSSLAISRRYVFGPSDDEPLVWYEGSGTSDKRYLVADERGSVIATTDGSGNALSINSYDEYGIPNTTNSAYQGRFGYTGQAWLPSLGMWYYKARMYSPTLGRFLQTDPIGYGDGLNWYNYVGTDPVNANDPSGLCETEVNGVIYTWHFANNSVSCSATSSQIDTGIRAYYGASTGDVLVVGRGGGGEPGGVQGAVGLTGLVTRIGGGTAGSGGNSAGQPQTTQPLTDCGAPPPGPPGASIDQNMRIAQYRASSESFAAHVYDMYNEFKAGGAMDYKKDYGGNSYVDFGNFNYGAYSIAAGISDANTTINAESYSLYSRHAFDQPRDRAMIRAGIAYAQCRMRK